MEESLATQSKGLKAFKDSTGEEFRSYAHTGDIAVGAKGGFFCVKTIKQGLPYFEYFKTSAEANSHYIELVEEYEKRS